MTTLPKLTYKQHEILELIYRHRFLDRIQIQALLHHKDKGCSSRWLKQLRDNHYVEWIYDGRSLAAKTKPAVYYLGLSGIRYLRTLGSYPEEELRKRYRESSRQPDFIEQCILVSEACIDLGLSREGVTYSSVTAADYADPDSDYHNLSELRPQLCFMKEITARGRTTTDNARLLEVFVSSSPRYMVRRRLKEFVEYLEGGAWEYDFEAKPIVLFACPTKADLIYAKRRTRKLLEDIVQSDDTHIRFATTQDMKSEGVTARIWEEA